MNNDDQFLRDQEPLAARDGFNHPAAPDPKPENPRAEGYFSEAFAEALKGTVRSGATSRGTTLAAWESIPSIGDFRAGEFPHEGKNPPIPTTQAVGGPAFDVNAGDAGLGDLLTVGPVRPDDSLPVDDGRIAIDRGPLGSVSALRPYFGEVNPRREGDRIRHPGGPDQGAGAMLEGSAGAFTSGRQDSLSNPFGPVDLFRLAAPELGASIGAASSDPPGTDSGSSLLDRPKGAFGLPGVNLIADQLALATGSLESANQASGPSPYSIDVHESAGSSTAFGPVLSGAGGSASGVGSTPGAPEISGAVGRSISSASSDAWFGQAGSEGVDSGNGSSPDLSRTNELLQHLLDEVRKGRQPFLPLNDRNPSV